MPTATSDIESYLSGYTPSTAATNTASSASKSGPATQTPSTLATSSPADSTPGPKSDSSGGLSSGATAGIGIGIALGVLAVALLVGWFIIRKRNQTRKSKVNGLGGQGQRLEGSDYEGDTWFRNEVEGNSHYPSQKPIEMEQQNGRLRQADPLSATDTSPVSPFKSELEAYSPYCGTPGGNELKQPGKQVNELEQPQARPIELEQPSSPLNRRVTIRHELE